MARPSGKIVPKYGKHRGSGQAVVYIGGKIRYLGPLNSKASLAEYDRLIAEWLANGRQVPGTAAAGDLTVNELIDRYRRHVEVHHVKTGRPTSEQASIAQAVKFVRRLYGEALVNQFGPLALKAVREKMLAADWARRTINAGVKRIRRMSRWGVENELVQPATLQALEAVSPLLQGKCSARESVPVMPVDDNTVDATLQHMPQVVADMVRLQRLTGCRPAEVCLLRPCDVDTSGEVWAYVPAEHKTEHHGKRCTIRRHW